MAHSLTNKLSSDLSNEEIIALDKQHVWHPYSSFNSPLTPFPVASAKGVRLTLEDGRVVIDGVVHAARI